MHTALIIGAGPGNGAAIAHRFAREGYHVCLTRRPRNLDQLEELADSIREEGGQATAFGVDARDEASMEQLVRDVEAIGPIDVCVFNIGANVYFPIAETTPRVFRKVWEMACYAGFLSAHLILPKMMKRERGTFIFTGATASVRGAAGFSAFAAAKAGLRNLAQSCAREAGPKNVHVAHIVLDGPVDGQFIRQNFPNADERAAVDMLLQPVSIADAYWQLHAQPRDAWTFEMDLRPYGESW